MKNNFYITETFDKEHKHLGGYIYPSDFNTDYRGNNNLNGSFIASRIASDYRWENKVLAKRKGVDTIGA